ncbi:glyoxalase, partial [Streptomyces sp. NRRL F-6602]
MKTWNVPSAPCWADLSAADPRAAAAFYERLFGWELGGVPGVCRATLCADSSGAVFGLWEPDGHQGFGRV